jgi:hypothetical protein
MIRALNARWLDAVLVAVALCALSLVFAPAVTGYLVVTRVSGALQRLSLLHNAQWTVLRREQGWFQTLLHTELTLADYAPVRVRLELVHGPIYLGMLARQRSPFLMAYLRATPSDALDDAPRFQAAVQFNGDWSARLDREDLVLRSLDGDPASSVALQALRADIDYTARLRALAVRAAAGRAELGDGGAQAQLVDLAALGEYRVDTSGWLFGDTSVRVASIVHPRSQGRVSGFELAASSTENGASAAASIALRTESSEFLERSFGAMELDATARRVSLTELRSWFHRSDSFSARALQSLCGNANLRLSQLTIRDREGAALVRARATARIAPAKIAHDTRLSLDLSASRAFSEFVFWHGAKRTLGRSALFGKLNELDDAEQSSVARASAAKQLSVLAARGYLTWNRGWYHTRVTLDAGEWALNGRPVNVR